MGDQFDELKAAAQRVEARDRQAKMKIESAASSPVVSETGVQPEKFYIGVDPASGEDVTAIFCESCESNDCEHVKAAASVLTEEQPDDPYKRIFGIDLNDATDKGEVNGERTGNA